MYSNAVWDLVEKAYAFLDREFPGRDKARNEVMIRLEEPDLAHDEFEVIFADCIVLFRGGKNPQKQERT